MIKAVNLHLNVSGVGTLARGVTLDHDTSVGSKIKLGVVTDDPAFTPVRVHGLGVAVIG